MFQSIMDYMKAGSPPHYVYLIAGAILLLEDGIARSRLKADSTIQLFFQLLGYVPVLGPLLGKLGPKAAAMVLVFVMGASGCGAAGQVLKNCELGKLPASLEAAIADGVAIAMDPNAYAQQLLDLGEKVLPGQAQCFLGAIETWIASKNQPAALAKVRAAKAKAPGACASRIAL